MGIFSRTKIDREIVAHDLAIICVMRDVTAVTPHQIADTKMQCLYCMHKQ